MFYSVNSKQNINCQLLNEGARKLKHSHLPSNTCVRVRVYVCVCFPVFLFFVKFVVLSTDCIPESLPIGVRTVTSHSPEKSTSRITSGEGRFYFHPVFLSLTHTLSLSLFLSPSLSQYRSPSLSFSLLLLHRYLCLLPFVCYLSAKSSFSNHHHHNSKQMECPYHPCIEKHSFMVPFLLCITA